MLRKSLFSKILLTILAFGFSLWFGGSVVRSTIGFDLFEPTTNLELKQNYSNEIQMHSVYLYATTSLYTGIGFIAAFLSSIALAVYWRKHLKARGWLFMSFALFFIASPVEFYLVFSDLKLSIAVYLDNVRDFASLPVTDYFYNRFKNPGIATPSALAFLAMITAVIYVVWRPLDEKQKESFDKKDNVTETNDVEQIPSKNI